MEKTIKLCKKYTDQIQGVLKQMIKVNQYLLWLTIEVIFNNHSDYFLENKEYFIKTSMNSFETRIRGFHARTVENIMSRTVCAPKQQKCNKSLSKKTDNLTTYLRKFQVDRQNLNLAKRILLCDSEHNHQKYKREWKKTQKFMRVRSNFKRNLCNQQPRIFKYEPVLGFGSMLLTIQFADLESNLIHFREENTYSLRIFVRGQQVNHKNNQFTLQTLKGSTSAFHIPKGFKHKKIWCCISELKQNNVYEKGKFWLKASMEGCQQSYIINKSSKVIGVIKYKLALATPKKLKDIELLNLTNCSNQNDDEEENRKSPKTTYFDLKKKTSKKQSKKFTSMNSNDLTNKNITRTDQDKENQQFPKSQQYQHHRNQSTPNNIYHTQS